MFAKSALGVAVTLFFGATPALAEDNVAPSPQTSVQFVGVIENTTAAPAAITGAEEFGELFASWEALDNGGHITRDGLVARAPEFTVSVPSRMPVEAVRMSSGYGDRNHPILRQRKKHNGVDLAAPSGTPVYATADGRIGKAQYWGSYGNYVQIEHGANLQTRYGHLTSYTVAAGDIVRKGDLIGYVGSTGRSTGPHLHYEVRVEGEPVNPIPYMVAQYDHIEEGEGGMGGPE